MLASWVPPAVESQLDTAWGIRRLGAKAESQKWVNSDSLEHDATPLPIAAICGHAKPVSVRKKTPQFFESID